MKRYQLFLATLLLLAGTAGLAGAEGGPLADAGLDQEVGTNTTVQLDGTGSSHPNGSIDRYTWSIDTPDGREITPECRNCARTRFTPHHAGRYEVTLTVTDRQGRTDSDTLYVDVDSVGPTVDLDGPTRPKVDKSATYTASATTTNAELEQLTWRFDNRTVARESLAGDNESATRSFSFSSTDTYRLVVVVRDSRNRTAQDTLTVNPKEPAGNNSGPVGNLAIETLDTTNEHNTGCQEAAVVSNPTGSGTAAAVTCADDSANVDRFADETCSATIENCELADPDGTDSDKSVEPLGDDDSLSETLDRYRNESFENNEPDRNRNSAIGITGGGWVL